MLRDKIGKIVKEAINELFGVSAVSSEVLIEVEKPQGEFGDYAVNAAFALAKRLGKPAQESIGPDADEDSIEHE